MADYFNIAANTTPNAFQEGFQSVLKNQGMQTENQLGKLKLQDAQQAQETGNQLRSLLPQAIGVTDPDQQTAMVKQLTAADPETGLKLQGYYQQQNAQQVAQVKGQVESTLAYLANLPDSPAKDAQVDGLIQKAQASPQFKDAAGQFARLRQSGAPSQQVIYAMHNYLNSGDAFNAPKVQDFKSGDESTQGVWQNGRFVPVQSLMDGGQPQQGQPQAPQGAPQQGAPQGAIPPQQAQQMVMQAAQGAGIPIPLALAVASQESRFHSNAMSTAGAQGVMQVMPGTAASPGFGIQPAQGNSPAENIRVGASYLGAMLKKYQGNVPMALAAYNAGPGAVDQALARSGGNPQRALSMLPAETQAYIPGVMGRMQQFSQPQAMGAAPNAQTVQQTPPVQVPAQGAFPAGFVVSKKTEGGGAMQEKIDAMRRLGIPEDQIKSEVLGGAQGTSAAPGNPTLTGDAYLATLPPGMAPVVKAIANGDQAPPSASSRSPQAQALLEAVYTYDPTANATNLPARTQTRKDFTSGKSAQNLRALNQAIGHLGQLDSQIGGTAGHSVQALNRLQNFYAEQTGDPGITNYNQTAAALAGELTQVFRGNAGAEADLNRNLAQLSAAQSTEQKKAAVKNVVGLLSSRIDELGQQYSQGMGRTVDGLHLLNPHAAAVLQRVSGVTIPADTEQPQSGWSIKRVQ